MFRLAHEFTFLVEHQTTAINSSCPQEVHEHHFTGQLIFESSILTQYGTLHTENDLLRFGDVLNSIVILPEQWSLELIAKDLYNHAKVLFPDLQAINLFMTNRPYRVAEYNSTGEKDILSDDAFIEVADEDSVS